MDIPTFVCTSDCLLECMLQANRRSVETVQISCADRYTYNIYMTDTYMHTYEITKSWYHMYISRVCTYIRKVWIFVSGLVMHFWMVALYIGCTNLFYNWSHDLLPWRQHLRAPLQQEVQQEHVNNWFMQSVSRTFHGGKELDRSQSTASKSPIMEFPLRYNPLSSGRFPSSVGTEPMSWLFLRSRFLSLRRFPNCEGMRLSNLLFANSNWCKEVHDPSSFGIVPASLLESKVRQSMGHGLAFPFVCSTFTHRRCHHR